MNLKCGYLNYYKHFNRNVVLLVSYDRRLSLFIYLCPFYHSFVKNVNFYISKICIAMCFILINIFEQIFITIYLQS